MILSVLAALLFLAALPLAAQNGTILNDEIHSVSLEGNLVGDSPKRSVTVYLPPDYEKNRKTRYPVVYLLHGFNGYGVGNKVWTRENGAFNAAAISRLITDRKISPMIIVMPDGSNRYGGSIYTNSITTGNWEDYLVRDLVAFIDRKYRTLPKAESRGIAGHSMGGYGALKIAMKHPDVFGAVYGSSSCCLVYLPPAVTPETMIAAKKLASFEEADKAPFGVRVSFAFAAAWSPNPMKPPFFSEYPFSENSADGERSAAALARWQANIPTYMADQYVTNLRRLRSIAFDAGTQEQGIQNANRQFAETLKRIRIEHTFEVFEGGHNDKVRERIETRMLPFFTKTLILGAPAKGKNDLSNHRP
jgi:enterochelin esterase-like enzyme